MCYDPAADPLFDEEGNRRSGTGEHVVLLRPSIRGDQVLPEARIEVCAWHEATPGKRTWQPPTKPLVVHYEGYSDQVAGE